MEFEMNDIRFGEYRAVELLTETTRLVLVTEVGPRIAFFGPRDTGKNVLFWNPPASERGDWHIYGGHRVWLSRPFGDESEDTYTGDNAPCEVTKGADWVQATAPVEKFTRTQRAIRVRFLKDNVFEVTNLIKNAGDLIYSGGVWNPTCIEPDGKIIRIPLGEKDVTWDLVKVVIPRVFCGNTLKLNDPQVTFTEDTLEIRSQGHVTKRCVCAPQGLISMEWPEEKLLFTKHSEFNRDAHYPVGGCNIAAFVGEDNWMGELETFGPERAIRPGETAENRETWTLTRL